MTVILKVKKNTLRPVTLLVDSQVSDLCSWATCFFFCLFVFCFYFFFCAREPSRSIFCANRPGRIVPGRNWFLYEASRTVMILLRVFSVENDIVHTSNFEECV